MKDREWGAFILGLFFGVLMGINVGQGVAGAKVPYIPSMPQVDPSSDHIAIEVPLESICSKSCPWTHKSVPEYNAGVWYEKEWEPFGIIEKEVEGFISETYRDGDYIITDPYVKQLSRQVFIYIKKRICKGDKP